MGKVYTGTLANRECRLMNPDSRLNQERKLLTSKWHLWLGIAVSAVLLLFLAWQVSRIEDPSGLIDELASANWFWLIPAVAVYFVGVLFRARRWQYLLAPLRPIPVRRLYPVVVIGYAANNLLPMRLGELVRSYYLARQENFNASSALGSVAVERVFDGLTLIALVAVTAPWLLLLGEFDWTSGISQTAAVILAAVVVLIFGGFLAVFTLLAVWPGFAGAVERLLGLLPGKLGGLSLRFFASFVSALGILNSPRKHLALAALSLPIWICEFAVYLLVSYCFDLGSHFSSTGVYLLGIALLTATSNLATGIPSAIGGIGPFEVVAQQTLTALGVAVGVAVDYALVVHLVALWLPVNVVGLTILWKQNLNLRQLTREPADSGAGSAPSAPVVNSSPAGGDS